MSKEQTPKQETPDSDFAFSRMKEEIEAQANKKAQTKIDEARKEAKKIKESAKQEAKSIKSDMLSTAKNEAQQQKVREISKKKQSLKMDYLESRESIIDEIYVEARSELQQFTKTDEYGEFLQKLVKSTAISIGGGNLVLSIRPEDKGHFTTDSLATLSKRITELTGVDTTISVADDDLDALGGITMKREDGRIFVDNTFERRLDRKNEQTRVALLDILG